ncbi:MAG: hypothetical protein GF308_04420 [Candidatus Heimdallarchaeota archaeon]|nr:hypothetical protein [Candidatus Heimdallarchaeota archaeon]
MKNARLRVEKGVIEVELLITNNKISSIKITGDFFIHPEKALEDIETSLISTETKKRAIEKVLKKVFTERKITSPGITREDFTEVIIQAINR